MLDRKEEEGFNLDFKRMDVSGEPSESDKKNLRESISGFANAAGGIILWGVESKSTDKKGDRSRFQKLVPVEDGERAAVRFHELTGVATQPPVSGVLHRSIRVDGGFVVKSLVPASDGGPHRTNEMNGQYFRRDADAFRAMQHHEIADMFGRRSRPKLDLVRSPISPVGARSSNYNLGTTIQFVVSIRNEGRGLARHIHLVLKTHVGSFSTAWYGLDGNGKTNLQRRPTDDSSRSVMFAGGTDDVIHPSSALDVTHIGAVPDIAAGDIPVSIEYLLYAEGVNPVNGWIVVTKQDIEGTLRTT